MSSKKLRNVRRMVFREGRPIDAALWNVYFEGASEKEVLKILKAYQEKDGSFRGLYDNASNDEAIRVLATMGFPGEAAGMVKKLKAFLETKDYPTRLEAAFLDKGGGTLENYVLGKTYSAKHLLEAFQMGNFSPADIGLGDVEKLKDRYREVLETEADFLEESCSDAGTWPGNIYRARCAVLNMLYITKVRSDLFEDR